MAYETIEDIYSSNQAIRENFIRTVEQINDDEASVLPEGEKWSIGQIVEHVSIVDYGIARICRKLVGAAKAAGPTSTETPAVSPEFLNAAISMANAKLEAPDTVQPTGQVTIADSIGRMVTNTAVYESLRPDLRSYDLSIPKFPHPYFGPLTAAEWLIMVGFHEERHRKQIERALQKIR